MTFEAFLDAIKQRIDAAFTDGTSLQYRKVIKNNGTELTGACLVRPCRDERYQMIYLEPVYRAVEQGTDLDLAVEAILERIGDPVPEELSVSCVDSWDKVRDRLFCRLIGHGQNEERLQNIVHRDFLDMAVCCCILFSGEAIGHGITEVRPEMLKLWNVTEEDALRQAEINTPLLMPAVLRTLTEAAFGEDSGDEALKDFYVLSNSAAFCGAAAVLYSDAVKKLSEQYGSDLYLLPTSIHEMILLPAAEFDAESLAEMVRKVNASGAGIPREEVLTDSVYLYERETGEIRLAD